MGHTKTNLHSPSRNRNAKMFKSLGHPARLAIIEYLLKSSSSNGVELRNETKLSQATFSQHMSVLTENEFIRTSYSGKELNYVLNNEKFFFMSKIVKFWKTRL